MSKRSSTRPKRVKIHAFVPEQLVRDSEETYRAEVAAGKLGITTAKVQARWTELGWLVARASTARERSRLVRDFIMGKPLACPKEGTS